MQPVYILEQRNRSADEAGPFLVEHHVTPVNPRQLFDQSLW
jgi:hypothetical protein